MKTSLALALVALLAGCAASSTPNYDARFGQAVRDARTLMVLNPDAGKSAGPVAGMDGKAAHEAMGRYYDSFKAPPPVVNVINIGGQTGTGGH
jgi:hypothetical protein